jgi:hypothetical protein
MGKLSVDEIISRGADALTSEDPMKKLLGLGKDIRREANKETREKAEKYERARAEANAKEDAEAAKMLEEKAAIDTDGTPAAGD